MWLPLSLLLGGSVALVAGVALLVIPDRVEKLFLQVLELFYGDHVDSMMIRTPRLGGALMVIFGLFFIGAAIVMTVTQKP